MTAWRPRHVSAWQSRIPQCARGGLRLDPPPLPQRRLAGPKPGSGAWNRVCPANRLARSGPISTGCSRVGGRRGRHPRGQRRGCRRSGIEAFHLVQPETDAVRRECDLAGVRDFPRNGGERAASEVTDLLVSELAKPNDSQEDEGSRLQPRRVSHDSKPVRRRASRASMPVRAMAFLSCCTVPARTSAPGHPPHTREHPPHERGSERPAAWPSRAAYSGLSCHASSTMPRSRSSVAATALRRVPPEGRTADPR